MDNIDRKILTILQENARTPLKVIAEQVFLSSPAVSARIERLEGAGLITGYQAQLSCAAMGYQIKAFISLEVEPRQKPEFYPYIESCSNVMECNCVTGDYSILAKTIDEMKWSKRPFVRYVISTSILEDVICVGVIALITGVANGAGFSIGAVGLSLGSLAVFFICTVVLGMIFVPRLLNTVSKSGSDEALLLTDRKSVV